MARSINIVRGFQQQSRDQSSPAKWFHENSKLTSQTKRELGERIKQIMTTGVAKRLIHAYKSYPYQPQIELPKANLHPQRGVQEMIVNRRSARSFDEEQPLSIQEVANLLQLSYGITGKADLGGNVVQYLRATPSGGGLYPLELYVIARRVQEIPPGLYHYRVAHHSLEQLGQGGQNEWVNDMEQEWGMPATAAAIFVISGIMDRSMVKYGERGYRFMMMEAGMVGQSLTWLAEIQGIKSSMMGGFVDDELNRRLGLDGVAETVLLPICLGKESSPKEV